ncbi:hypothetical protein [Dactylosporangium sp. NPDC051541]|uniref:hypothetical protein n=1 Tax=Dactylosporangium sp. NPDC051541 TaxID=3363977 RepID=UPI0037B72FC8
MTSSWHVTTDDLRLYAAGRCGPPLLWSVESHLVACPACREQLTGLAEPALLGDGWAALDAALDAPRPGPVERLLGWAGVPEHTARLLVATPALRLSWLGAIALTLILTVSLAWVAEPMVFLGAAPMLPLLSVAVSFGPGLDPTYEMGLVAPIDALRLLFLRVVAVVAATAALCTLACLTLPDLSLAAAAWFLPSLALTVLALLLATRFGMTSAAVAVAAGWTLLVGLTYNAPFTAAGQVTSAVAAAVAFALLAHRARGLDPARFFPRRTR